MNKGEMGLTALTQMRASCAVRRMARNGAPQMGKLFYAQHVQL